MRVTASMSSCSTSSCPASPAWTRCERLIERRPDLPVIVVTATGGIDTVVQAMRAGAVDFFVKPASPERIAISIRNALKLSDLRGEVKRLQENRRPHGLRGHDRRRARHARRRAPRPARGRVLHPDPDPRRSRASARKSSRAASRAPPSAPASRSSRSTAAPSRRTWSSRSCSATRRARSPAPPTRSSASSSKPTAARCSSTKSANCRSTCR